MPMVVGSIVELRRTCDDMGIRWHHKHKVSSLEGLIKEKMAEAPAEPNQVDPLCDSDMSRFPERAREKRHIPQDVLSALEYCDGYHRGNTRRIREYIESLL